MAGSPLVRATGLRMAFGGVPTLKDVSVDLFPGEVHAIVGENGAGKSTVAKIIGGVYQPVGGEIEVNGVAVRILNPRQAIQLGIALIHQEPLTFPDLEVSENIYAGYQPTKGRWGGVDWKLMRAEAGRILGRLGCSVKATDRVGHLSIADRQMVELAVALSHDAKVLLLDETTASLTPKEVEDLFKIVRTLRDEGCAIAFVSHRLDEVFAIANRITVLRDGEKVAERLPSETTPDEIVSLMVGRTMGAATYAARPKGSSEKPILEVRSLSDGLRFKDVSFQLHPGEILGLGGMVGAGRTEICEALFGIRTTKSGQIVLNGEVVRVTCPANAIGHGLAFVPEDRQHNGLFLPLDIVQNTTAVKLKSFSVLGWLNPSAERAEAEGYAAKFRTKCRSVAQSAQELSGGNQQKIVLSKWLLTKPAILILDEPTRGVDVGAKAEIHLLIRELVEKEGLAIILVSSDLSELLGLSDRLLILRQGRITGQFDRDEADPEEIMRAAAGEVALAG